MSAPNHAVSLVRLAAAEQRPMDVCQWLERELCGRHTPDEIAHILEAMTTAGAFTWPGTDVRYQVTDTTAFARQIDHARRYRPELLSTDLPDHFLGEY